MLLEHRITCLEAIKQPRKKPGPADGLRVKSEWTRIREERYKARLDQRLAKEKIYKGEKERLRAKKAEY